MPSAFTRVEELPVFQFNDSLITYDQLVSLIGEEEADKCIKSLGTRQWVVNKYIIGGMALWVDLSIKHSELRIRHYYED